MDLEATGTTEIDRTTMVEAATAVAMGEEAALATEGEAAEATDPRLHPTPVSLDRLLSVRVIRAGSAPP
jgi:hypothetical protein